MGLSVVLMIDTDTGWHAPYSTFGKFREQLATTVGIELSKMQGYCSQGIPWTGEEPFYELLDHDDNEGELHYDECIELLEDFKKYEDKFIINAFSHQIEDYYQWIYLLEECVRKEGVLMFR